MVSPVPLFRMHLLPAILPNWRNTQPWSDRGTALSDNAARALFLAPSTIPHELFDPNAVLFLNSGGFPKPNSGFASVALSVKAPTFVREDLVRIDHAINEKMQLMGHFIHDSVNQNYARIHVEQ